MPKLEDIPGYPTLGKRTGSGVIYLRSSYPGLGEVVRSTKTRDLREAIKRAKALEREILKLDPDYEPVRLEAVAHQVYEERELTWREGSRMTARQVLENRILPEFGSLYIEEMSDARWTRFAKRFYETNPGKKLFNTRKYMLLIMNYAHRKGLVKQKLELPINDLPPEEGMFISDEHFHRLLGSCKGQAFCDDARFEKLRLFCIIAYYMGCRRREILKLSWDRVDLEAQTITFGAKHVKTGSKTKRGRTIQIAPEVLPELIAWKAKHPGRWLFKARGLEGPQADNHQVWNRAIERAGLPAYTPNDLRHTWFTRKVCIEKLPVADVAAYGGSSVQVVEKTYLHQKPEHTRGVVDPKFRTESEKVLRLVR